MSHRREPSVQQPVSHSAREAGTLCVLPPIALAVLSTLVRVLNFLSAPLMNMSADGADVATERCRLESGAGKLRTMNAVGNGVLGHLRVLASQLRVHLARRLLRSETVSYAYSHC